MFAQNIKWGEGESSEEGGGNTAEVLREKHVDCFPVDYPLLFFLSPPPPFRLECFTNQISLKLSQESVQVCILIPNTLSEKFRRFWRAKITMIRHKVLAFF